MTSNYPAWAPPELIAAINADDWRVIPRTVLERVATDPDMEVVWRSLARRPRANYASPDYVRDLLLNCAIAAKGPTTWELKTRGEQVNETDAIAKSAMHLADLLERSGLPVNNTFFYYLDEKQKTEIGPLFRFDELIMNHLVDCGAIEAIDDVHLPEMSGLLRVLAEKAEDIAQGPKILSNPNIKNARRIFFIRRMNSYMERVYETPLHNVVASLARIFLDDEKIEISTVRDAIKYWRG